MQMSHAVKTSDYRRSEGVKEGDAIKLLDKCRGSLGDPLFRCNVKLSTTKVKNTIISLRLT